MRPQLFRTLTKLVYYLSKRSSVTVEGRSRRYGNRPGGVTHRRDTLSRLGGDLQLADQPGGRWSLSVVPGII